MQNTNKNIDRKSTISRSSELLVHGWTLLNTGCPICNTNEDKFCAGCELPVKYETEIGNEEVEQLTEVPSPLEVIENNSVSTSLESERLAFEELRKKRDIVTKSLGDRMLQGWTLLAESCPQSQCDGTPLMSRKGSPLECLCCGKRYSKDSINGNITEENIEEPRINTSSSVQITSNITTKNFTNSTFIEMLSAIPFLDEYGNPIVEKTSSTSTSRNDTIDVSKLISDKLLRGWALLDDCCVQPDCHGQVPLMRDKSGQKVCVKCTSIAMQGLPGTTSQTTEKPRPTPAPSMNNHQGQVVPKESLFPSQDSSDLSKRKREGTGESKAVKGREELRADSEESDDDDDDDEEEKYFRDLIHEQHHQSSVSKPLISTAVPRSNKYGLLSTSSSAHKSQFEPLLTTAVSGRTTDTVRRASQNTLETLSEKMELLSQSLSAASPDNFAEIREIVRTIKELAETIEVLRRLK